MPPLTMAQIVAPKCCGPRSNLSGRSTKRCAAESDVRVTSSRGGNRRDGRRLAHLKKFGAVSARERVDRPTSRQIHSRLPLPSPSRTAPSWPCPRHAGKIPVALITAQRDRVVPSYTLLAAIGRLSSQVLGCAFPSTNRAFTTSRSATSGSGSEGPDGLLAASPMERACP
jgi:hypothetical protein